MIKSIQLNHFRNFETLVVDNLNNINVIIGKNGVGKTNLLESIYFMSNIRSFKTKIEKSLINNTQQYAKIEIKTNNDNLICVLHKQGKYFSKNNKVIEKTSEILGHLNTVIFYPNETKFFSETPSFRRSFFDLEIGKISKEYTKAFQNFNKLLKDRNKMFKEATIDEILLEIITDKLIDNQIIISKYRNNLVKFINSTINKHLNKLSLEPLNVKMQYLSNIKNLDKVQLKQLYKNNLNKDKLFKATSNGIHRDDYSFIINEVEVSQFLSSGQIRLTLLAIKFSLIDYIIEKNQSLPILLLDDVFSELDEIHQYRLIKSIRSDIQTFITTTDNHNIFLNQKTKIFLIKNNQIISKENNYDK